MIIPRFVNGNVALAPFFNGVDKFFFEWLNDPDIQQFMGDFDLKPFTESDAERYVESHKKDTWIILNRNSEDENKWNPVGYIGVFIRPRHRIGIMRIGLNSESRGKGIAYKANRLAIKWCFDFLDLVAIHLSVSDGNKKSIALNKKIGFIECGRYASSRFENGKRYDEILMEYTIKMYRKSIKLKNKV